SKPTKKPEYGIMCTWSDGHNIIYHSKRPVVLSNFGNDVPNFTYANGFFVAESESLANEVMDSLNCKYVYLANWQYDLECIILYMKKSLSDYFDFFTVKDNYGISHKMMVPKIEGYSVAISRLYRFLGSGAYMEGVYFPPYRHYRLLYVSDDKTIKTFEYVKGAVVKGKTLPNLPVVLSLPIKLKNSSFTYFDSLMTDVEGIFITTVPYSADSLNPYTVRINGKEIRLVISDNMIERGDTNIISFPR
ncbi:MAG: hypothetical protein ABIL22_03155, partial [candidate division WOR-3 bacterium]